MNLPLAKISSIQIETLAWMSKMHSFYKIKWIGKRYFPQKHANLENLIKIGLVTKTKYNWPEGLYHEYRLTKKANLLLEHVNSIIKAYNTGIQIDRRFYKIGNQYDNQ